MSELEKLQKQLEVNIFEIASKNKEIKRLKDELEKIKEPGGLKKLEDENKRLKELNAKDQKEIDNLLNQIFDIQTNVSKQMEEIRLLNEENKKLKSSEI